MKPKRFCEVFNFWFKQSLKPSQGDQPETKKQGKARRRFGASASTHPIVHPTMPEVPEVPGTPDREIVLMPPTQVFAFMQSSEYDALNPVDLGSPAGSVHPFKDDEADLDHELSAGENANRRHAHLHHLYPDIFGFSQVAPNSNQLDGGLHGTLTSAPDPHSQAENTEKFFPFLYLPDNVRLIIYSLLMLTLGGDTVISPSQLFHKRICAIKSCASLRPDFVPGAGLLRTCWSIYLEAAPILYAATRFKFTDTMLLHNFLANINNINAEAIRSIEIRWDDASIKLLMQELQFLTGLERLEIWFPSLDTEDSRFNAQDYTWVFVTRSQLSKLKSLKELEFVFAQRTDMDIALRWFFSPTWTNRMVDVAHGRKWDMAMTMPPPRSTFEIVDRQFGNHGNLQKWVEEFKESLETKMEGMEYWDRWWETLRALKARRRKGVYIERPRPELVALLKRAGEKNECAIEDTEEEED